MPESCRHSLLEDAQTWLSGTLRVAFAIVLFRQAGLQTGGTPGLAFVAHYASGVSFGLLYFLINIPFHIFGCRALGKALALKAFCAALLLSLFSELLGNWIRIASIAPLFAAVRGGLLAGAGLLMLIRRQAGIGGAALLVVDPERVALSIVGALALYTVLAINHRPGRCFGE